MIRKMLLICALALLAAAAPAESAPKLSLKDLRGQTAKLSALRGRIVVLNFWATWCEPCQEELARLPKLSQNYVAKNVQFVAFRLTYPRTARRSSRCCVASTLPSMSGPAQIWTRWKNFGLGNVVPGTMVIDEKGQVVARDG